MCQPPALLCCALFSFAAAPTMAQAQTPPAPPPAPAAAAQTPAAPSVSPSPQSTTPAATPATQVSEDEADLVISASVTARELRFEVVPNPTVEFPGRPRRETAWEAGRTNLPRPVQPGVTYRDIGVRLKIVSVFADIELTLDTAGRVVNSRVVSQATGTRRQ